MSATPLLTTDLVHLDRDLGDAKGPVIEALARLVGAAGRTDDVAGLARDLLAREETAATGLPGGIAIPHCRTTAVEVPTVLFARLSRPVDFGAKDGPADLVFVIAAPDGGGATHLQVLTQLARALVRPDFAQALREAPTAEAVASLVGEALGEAGPTASSTGSPTTRAGRTDPPARRRLVAVTACPTGIAHTYMAAEALEAAAREADVDLQVETQGSAGSTPLSPEVIAAADAVILAVDVGVRDKHRFAGRPVVATGVKRAIEDADGLIRQALAYADDPAAPRVASDGDRDDVAATTEAEGWGARTRRVLMTGVSYMIPFVAAGGLLIALGFLFGGYDITGAGPDIATGNSLFDLPDIDEAGLTEVPFDSPLMAYLGALFFTLGATAFGFLVPALAGYIAFAIADRPGIAPGFVMGALAVTLESGFLGGIVGGVLAGTVALWVARRPVPTWARGLMPVVVIPLVSTIVAGAVMVVVLARPLAGLMDALERGLTNLDGGSAIVLGVVLGLMMAFDMGGPLNKTAYAFATAGLGTAAAAAGSAPELRIMAAVMLAGMVPPLGLALATAVRPRLFTPVERENGKAAWLLGASFITEGAIPFAAADPVRVIPSIMAGSAVTGALSMAGDVTLRAPHGGVFVLFAVGNVVWFLLALLAGMLVTAASVSALKGWGRTETTPAPVAAQSG